MKAARTDDNHASIRKALRDIPGVKVHDTSAVHGGFPDLIVGYRGRNFLFEIKDPAKAPSRQRLTESQEIFHGNWTGHVAIITSVDQALAHLGLL